MAMMKARSPLSSTLDDEAFVRHVYRSLLRRDPDQEGAVDYAAKLAADWDRGRLVNVVRLSGEATTRMTDMRMQIEAALDLLFADADLDDVKDFLADRCTAAGAEPLWVIVEGIAAERPARVEQAAFAALVEGAVGWLDLPRAGSVTGFVLGSDLAARVVVRLNDEVVGDCACVDVHGGMELLGLAANRFALALPAAKIADLAVNMLAAETGGKPLLPPDRVFSPWARRMVSAVERLELHRFHFFEHRAFRTPDVTTADYRP